AGDTVRLAATGLDRNGYTVSGATFQWRSGSACVATVNAGLVTARGGGVTTVIAAPVSGGRTDTAAVSVVGAPSGQPEIAYNVIHAGEEYPDRSIWGLCPVSDTGMVLIGASGAGWSTLPSWSPDGARLAFSTEDFWSCGDIYTARVDGSDQRRVTPDYHIGRTGTCSFYLAAPAWSPDGTQIAFSVVDERTLSGGCGISVINADGSNLRGLSAG